MAEPDPAAELILGIDLGEKRVGLAMSERGSSVASPFKALCIDDPDELAAVLAAAVAELSPDRLVIGIPIRMDGTEGPAAQRAREVAETLSSDTGVPVTLVDERLTSAKVHTLARSSSTSDGKSAGRVRARRPGVSHSKKRRQTLSAGGIDVLSATLILQTYMHGSASAGSVGKGG